MAKKKIDTSVIPGFESMTADEKVNALLGYEFEDNSEELSRVKSDLDKQKRATDKASSEAAEFKKQLRDKMSESEKAEADRQAELENLRKENEEFKKSSKVSEYKATAIALGYSDELATKRANAMYDCDFEALGAIEKEFLEAHDAAINADNLSKTPKPPVGGNKGGNTVNAEQFNNMGYRERLALHDSNPELYAELTKE